MSVKNLARYAVPAMAVLSVVLGSGCAAFRQSVKDVNPDEAKAFDAKYDYSDLRTMTDEIRDELLAIDEVKKAEQPPVLVVLGVENRTSVHMETKALTDALTAKLIQSGKVKFVNAARRDDLLKEQQYHLQNVRQDQRVAIGKQLGAKYMLTGTMAEITKETGRQVRVSKKEERWYQLTIEVTDLETGMIVGMPQCERVRQASQPLIGW